MSNTSKNKYFHVAHGGHSGDIIYSLPFVEYLSDLNKKNIIYHIISDRSITLGAGMQHPNGLSTGMTQKAYKFIRPLLVNQFYIQDILFTKLSDLPKDIFILDYYRDISGLNLAAGSLQSWPRKYFGIDIKTESKWIHATPSEGGNKVVCGFSRRYRNTAINYQFLDDCDCCFIGIPDEYTHFIEMNNLKKIRYVRVNDALEAAKLIKSSNLYLGNQSLFFSIAEGLKVNRALEVCEIVPNVIPSGDGAYEYLNQNALTNILVNHGIDPGLNPNKMDANFSLYW